MVGNKASRIEHDLLQLGTLRAFGDRRAKTCCSFAIEFKREVERCRILPLKGRGHLVRICNVSFDSGQIRKWRICHGIGAPHTSRDSEAFFQKLGDQRLALIGWRTQDADFLDCHVATFQPCGQLLPRRNSECAGL